MPSLRHAARSNSRETIETLRGKVVQFRSAALPRAAEMAENTGEAVSKLALSSSEHLAHALRSRQPSKATSFMTFLPPLMRTGMRFAVRNPAFVAGVGLGAAAVGFLAWRRQQAAAAQTMVAEDSLSEDHPAVREL